MASKALEIAEGIGRQELVASDCYILAKSLLRKNQPVEALPYIHRAVEIFRRLGSKDSFKAQEIQSECETLIQAEQNKQPPKSVGKI